MSRTAASTSEVTVESETTTINYVEFAGDSLLIELGYADEDTGELFDLTNWDVRFEMRADKTSSVALLQAFTANGTIQINHDTANGYNIKIPLSNIQTAAVGPGSYYYFIETTDTLDFVNTLVVGSITLKVK